MKHVLLVYLILISTFTHARDAIFAAGEIRYEYVSNDTYRFYAQLYADCAGGQEPSSIALCFNNPCGTSSSFTTQLNKVNNREAFAQIGCSQHATNCNSPYDTIPGYRICIYEALVIMPATCSAWTIAFTGDTASATLNLQPARFHIETTLNNTIPSGNSSPFFVEDAVYYGGEGVPGIFNNQAIDPDGDSLVFDIVQPLTAINNCGSTAIPNNWVSESPKLNDSTNPFACNNTFLLNEASGNMTFTGVTAGTSIITIKTTEYRNGVITGSVLRNQVLHLLPSPIHGEPLQFIPSFGNVHNCVWNGYRIEAYMQDSFSFDMGVSATANDARLMMYNSADTSMPIANVTYTNQYSKSLIATVSAKPEVSDTGRHYILFKIVDSTCRPPGFIYNSYLSVEVFISSIPVGVISPEKYNNVILYPSPNKGQFQIKGIDIAKVKLELINSLGQLVANDMVTLSNQVIVPANLPAGIYAIRIKSDGKTETIPFMLSR